MGAVGVLAGEVGRHWVEVEVELGARAAKVAPTVLSAALVSSPVPIPLSFAG